MAKKVFIGVGHGGSDPGAIGNGLKEKNMPIWKMIVLSFIFGLFQFGMPVIGYFVGSTFKEYIEPYIPWIAFSLLTLLAIKSFVEWIRILHSA